MINIANPAYDAAFKYLMEDKRVAIIILSALLKKKVVNVEFRKNEYSNIERDKLSIFRIDFGATVENEDGSRSLILVELQKTWLETETLRFRQYLGWQYSSRDNMIQGDKDGNALPMVTIYILGHRVGDIEEPVVYVRHKVYDYKGNVVTHGVPDPFIESLTHDCIIVQIPLLHGQVSNRLEEILTIFDQSGICQDAHLLRVDESGYQDDSEMSRIIARLTAAAADSKIRHEMNVEDEYFGILEDRETKIQMQSEQLAEQGVQINEQIRQLAEQGAQIKEQNEQLAEQSAQIQEQNEQLAQQGARIQEQKTMIASLAKKMLSKGLTVGEFTQAIGQDEEFLKSICPDILSGD